MKLKLHDDIPYSAFYVLPNGQMIGCDSPCLHKQINDILVNRYEETLYIKLGWLRINTIENRVIALANVTKEQMEFLKRLELYFQNKGILEINYYSYFTSETLLKIPSNKICEHFNIGENTNQEYKKCIDKDTNDILYEGIGDFNTKGFRYLNTEIISYYEKK